MITRLLYFTLTLSILVGFQTQSSQAQGKVVFEKLKHNFGQIKEDDLAEISFEFTNTGNQPVKLLNVKASCGCTTPTWTQEAVAPGKTGVVKAVYNTHNRPGAFNKSITVTTDGEPRIVSLMISGNVSPRPRGPKDWFPAQLGSLRTKNRNVYFNKVLHDQNAVTEMLLYNESAKAIQIDLAKTKASLPAHVSLSANAKQINPQDSVKLTFTYDPIKKNDWGYVSDRFILVTNDPKEATKQLYISANIVENFGKVDENSKFPIVKFDKTSHNFGKVNQNTRSTAIFTLSNMGDAPLMIRKTKASCGCTASQPKKTTLAPGESTTIEVSYNSAGKNGMQKQNVTIITNDPANTTTRLNIQAEVLKPGGSNK